MQHPSTQHVDAHSNGVAALPAAAPNAFTLGTAVVPHGDAGKEGGADQRAQGPPGLHAKGSMPRVSEADEVGAKWSTRYDDLLHRAAAGVSPLVSAGRR